MQTRKMVQRLQESYLKTLGGLANKVVAKGSCGDCLPVWNDGGKMVFGD